MFVLMSTIISILLVLLPSLGVTARRLHDKNRSAGFLLLELVPIIGGIYILILCAEKGTSGENDYGKKPEKQCNLSN